MRTRYNLGDSLDLSGLVVSAVLEDGSLRELRQNRDFTVDTSEFDSSVSWQQGRIRIFAGHFRANFFVRVMYGEIDWPPIWDGDIFYKNNGEYYWCDKSIEILISGGGSGWPLSVDDFKMLDNIANVINYVPIMPGERVSCLMIKNEGRQNVLDTIRELERLRELGRLDFAFVIRPLWLSPNLWF